MAAITKISKPPSPMGNATIGCKQPRQDILPLDIHNVPYTPLWASPLPLDLPTPTSTCSKNSQEQKEDFGEYPVSFPIQFFVLLKRAFLLITRDKTLSKMRLVMHLLIGVLIGVLYYQIGNEANHVIDNFGFLMSCIMFLMFTAFSSMVLTCCLNLRDRAPIITVRKRYRLVSCL
uniref:(California timema) hypothetical protein n=1 Tax=Timema californicum TaxID=61474 RepID=A0A7R9JFH3_TIMCA|nr:unnamed protein product [Timema californicum]